METESSWGKWTYFEIYISECHSIVYVSPPAVKVKKWVLFCLCKNISVAVLQILSLSNRMLTGYSVCVCVCGLCVPVLSSVCVARFSIHLAWFLPKVRLPTAGLQITQRTLSVTLMLFLTKTSVVACHGRCSSCFFLCPPPPPTKIGLVNSSRRDLKYNSHLTWRSLCVCAFSEHEVMWLHM